MNKTEEECSSGACSPVFGWSPLMPRKTLAFSENTSVKSLPKLDSKDLYPNCDANIWLRSCDEEIIEPLEGKTTGVIPNWLSGCLIRNGPGSIKVGDNEYNHLFDCSALLHRFAIKDGKVTYQCRFLQSETFKKNQTANRIVLSEFGSKSVPDPCHTIFDRITSIFTKEVSDNSMISVYPFGDELYAFNESPIIHKVNAETLATEDRLNVSNYVSIVQHTSHPHVTNEGNVYNLGMSMHTLGPYHNIICFPKQTGVEKSMFKDAKIVASIRARWPLNPSYMHTFGITDSYFIIVEQPLSISIPGLVKSMIQNEPLAGSLRWYNDKFTQINVVSKKTGALKCKFFSQPFFYFHLINQYETEEYIVLDICMYVDPSMMDCMYLETMKAMQQNPDYAKMFRGRPARFVLPLKPSPMEKTVNENLIKFKNSKAKAYYLPNGSIIVTPEKLCNLGCETPRINYDNYSGKPYKYFYAISSDVDAENPGTIIKVDTEAKTAKTWCETNCFPSEPVFVASPDSKEEDDGIILSAMIWGQQDTNHAGLLILNAKTLKEIARAEFQTKSPVPKCLHGWFLSQ